MSTLKTGIAAVVVAVVAASVRAADKPTFTVFVQPPTRGGFVDADRGVLDSIKDVTADRTGISGRLPYVWKNRKDRTGRWFRLALERAEHAGVQRIRAEAVGRALDRSDAMLLAILRARDPWFLPKPKEVGPKTTITHVQQNNYANATITASGLTDAELEFMDRILKKMGVPEQLLKPALPAPDVVDVEAQAVVQAQPSRYDNHGPK